MKFLQISDYVYVNVDRIDTIARDMHGDLNICVGGSEEPWCVSGLYVDKVLAYVHENRENLEDTDAISRHDAIHLADELKDDLPDDEQMADIVTAHNEGVSEYQTKLSLLPPVTPQPKMGHCKDCKWWKDSDGLYRRGGHAESQCPINRREVFEGNGYCYMFEPQESEGNND